MFGPVVGNFFNSRREFLYEQCSLHITEKIPSSVKFGSRQRMFLIRSYSSDVRPCLATISGVTSGSTMELTLFTRPNVIRCESALNRAIFARHGIDRVAAQSKFYG